MTCNSLGALLLAPLLAACVIPPPGGTGRRSAGPKVRIPVETAWMEAVEPARPGEALEPEEREDLADALGRLEYPEEFGAYAAALREIVEFGPRVAPYLGWYADWSPGRNDPPEPAVRVRARETCAVLLETILEPVETAGLLEALASEHASVIGAAAAVLGARGSTEALPALVDLLGDDRAPVRRSAIAALRRLTNEFFEYRPDAPSGQRNRAIVRWREYLDRQG